MLIFQSAAEKSHLFCWLEANIHKFYTIGPLKMEFLSRSPDVIQIYGAVTEKETEKIILSSENHLAASGVLGTYGKPLFHVNKSWKCLSFV